MITRHGIVGALLTLAALAIPFGAGAQTLHITPALIDAGHTVEQALEANKGHESTTIEGAGSVLTIEYRSTEPLEIYMVPMRSDNMSYIPTDYLHFTLPLTTKGTVDIDLTVSPGWSNANIRWQLSLLSTSEEADAAFTGMSFSEQKTGKTFVSAFRHFFTQELYTPSSYHALRGYRVLGSSFTFVFGILTVLSALVCLFFFPKYVFTLLMICSLFYQARFSIDLVRFTANHTSEYANGSYDAAGSIHAVAGVLRGLAKTPEDTHVYVCRDGTNFKEKLLRYFTYPIHISSDSGATLLAQYAVVMDKFKWGFETIVDKDTSSVTLKCGDLNRKAQKLTTFPSSEILFKIL